MHIHLNCASEEEMRMICEVSVEAGQKSLTLLRAIDFTIEALGWLEKQITAPILFLENTIEAVKSCERKLKIDENGIVCSAALSAEETAVELYNVLVGKRTFALNTKELDGVDKEAIVAAYSSAIAAVADLHNTFADLRWAIGEHDADLDQPSGSALSTAQEISDYLDAL